MNGSSNHVRLPVVDRKVDTGGDLIVRHGFAGVRKAQGGTILVNWAGSEMH